MREIRDRDWGDRLTISEKGRLLMSEISERGRSSMREFDCQRERTMREVRERDFKIDRKEKEI